VKVAGIRASRGEVEILELPERGPPAHDEVLIAVKAAGVANWDEIVRTGGWDVGAHPPMALGVEAAGEIAAVGENVVDRSPGDAVMTHPLPLRDQGTWAPWLIAPAGLLARKPANASWEAAAAFPVPALTAYQALHEAACLEDRERLLVHGAGGVTGRVLVSLGSLVADTVIATAGPASHDRVKELGATHIVDYHDPSWPDAVRELTGGEGVDAAVNAVPGGASVAIGAVRDAGRLATITSDPPEEQRGIRVSTVYVRSDGGQLELLADRLARGQLEIQVGAVFDRADAAEALATATAGRAGGAVVLTF
jgi:NADPH:quinone reductase-like Zn-dependent oxidoreductase